MESFIRSNSDEKGIGSTLYNTRRCEIDIQKFSDFKNKLLKKNERTGFAHAINLNLHSKKKRDMVIL